MSRNPKIVRTIQTFFGQSKNFPDNPETVWTIQNMSRQSRNCPDNPEIVQIIQKLDVVHLESFCVNNLSVQFFFVLSDSAADSVSISSIIAGTFGFSEERSLAKLANLDNPRLSFIGRQAPDSADLANWLDFLHRPQDLRKQTSLGRK